MKVRLASVCYIWTLAHAAAASAITDCPLPPNQVTVTVTADVQFDASSGLYIYSYIVANDTASQQDLDEFAIDVTLPVQDLARPAGWTSALLRNRDSVLWGALGMPIETPDLPPGGIPPSDAQLSPGASLSGFGFRSPNPPGEVVYYAVGFFQPLAADTEEEVERMMEECPDVVGSVFELGDTGTTFGPIPQSVALALSPDPLEFGEAPVGETVGPLELTLTSTGTEPLTIQYAALAEHIPEYTRPFTLVEGGSCDEFPVTLPPGQSCTLWVTFTPCEAGPATWLVEVWSDAPTSIDEGTVQGQGTGGPGSCTGRGNEES